MQTETQHPENDEVESQTPDRAKAVWPHKYLMNARFEWRWRQQSVIRGSRSFICRRGNRENQVRLFRVESFVV